jgi:predicted CoA-substrate-specific enzyme activase
MKITAGIDIGSTYTKTVLLDEESRILARHMQPTGFKLQAVAKRTFLQCVEFAGIREEDVKYVVSTGMGRHMVDFKNVHATDLTAAARGAAFLFPGTRTVLDIGGQTMKASRLDDTARVKSFRLNDKCAAGTGAFLEKTARYMGFNTEEISALLSTSKEPASISGVCAVFAESEVINQLSLGTPPADIMMGSLVSLVERAVQLMKRVKAQEEFTLIGGILRFSTMAKTVSDSLGTDVNVPEEDLPQFVAALGAAILGQIRLRVVSPDPTLSETVAPAAQ